MVVLPIVDVAVGPLKREDVRALVAPEAAAVVLAVGLVTPVAAVLLVAVLPVVVSRGVTLVCLSVRFCASSSCFALMSYCF